MHLVHADGVVSGPFPVIQAVAKRKSALVKCSSDGQIDVLRFSFVHEGNLRMLDYIQARAQRANECPLTLSHSIRKCADKMPLFPLEYRFDFRSQMRTILPVSCSLLRSWTVLPSGL